MMAQQSNLYWSQRITDHLVRSAELTNLCLRSWERNHFQGATDRVKSRLTELGLIGRVELSDTSVHLRDFYPRLDVYTHGSRVGEGFGVVMAEAMANRLPVVTIATPGRKKSNAQGEIVEHNVTGFVCRWRW